MDMAERGQALAVIGNHDDKFMRWLKGRNVKLTHGLERTVEQYAGAGRRAARRSSPSSTRCRSTPGSTTVGSPSPTPASRRHARGATTPQGARLLPLRRHLRARRRRRPARALQLGGRLSRQDGVVYGHTPVAEPEWLNNTMCIDTGCVFGGKLTALRWPERELVSVPAREAYAELRRRTVCRPRARPPRPNPDRSRLA